MNFEELTQHFVLVVLVACLVVGYILKVSFKKFPNDFIPLVLAILGAVVNCIVAGVTVENIVYGALTGLASTGMHQAFTRFIQGVKNNTSGSTSN